MGFQPLTEGTLVADGSEQLMFSGTGPGRYSGYIDLSNMLAGDTIILREYILIGGIYKIYHTESLAAPSDPILHVEAKESIYGVRLTLQQSVGILKSFVYQFIVETMFGTPIVL